MNLICFAEVHYLDTNTNYLLMISYDKESKVCIISVYKLGSGTISGTHTRNHKRLSKKYKYNYVRWLVQEYLIRDVVFELTNYFIPENYKFTNEDIIGMFSEYWLRRGYSMLDGLLGKNLLLEQVEINEIIQRYVT